MEEDSVHTATAFPQRANGTISHPSAEVMEIGAPARAKRRMKQGETDDLILRMCSGRYLALREIAAALDRSPNGIRLRFVARLVREGRLAQRFPNEPNRPDQAYTAPQQTGGPHEDQSP